MSYYSIYPKLRAKDLILILDNVEDKFRLIEKMVDKTLSKGLIVTREPILEKIRDAKVNQT